MTEGPQLYVYCNKTTLDVYFVVSIHQVLSQKIGSNQTEN